MLVVQGGTCNKIAYFYTKSLFFNHFGSTYSQLNISLQSHLALSIWRHTYTKYIWPKGKFVGVVHDYFDQNGHIYSTHGESVCTRHPSHLSYLSRVAMQSILPNRRIDITQAVPTNIKKYFIPSMCCYIGSNK